MQQEISWDTFNKGGDGQQLVWHCLSASDRQLSELYEPVNTLTLFKLDTVVDAYNSCQCSRKFWFLCSLGDLSYIFRLCVSAVCWFLLFVLLIPFPTFRSDLACPDVRLSSGTLLFSCSLRYLLHRLPPFTYMHSFFMHLLWTRWPQFGNKHTKMCFLFLLSALPAHARLLHTYAFKDNIITGCLHLGTPTVDPRAQSTIRGAQKSIRSQLLCNWVRY